MKGILTNEHVKIVEKEAENPAHRIPGVISFGIGAKSPFSIIKISSKGLIFIKGTDDTGFDHIHQRHSFHSSKIFWDNFYNNKGDTIEREDSIGRKKLRLDNPSSFNPNSIPIFDYVKIADKVYSSKNINLEKNKNKELFDVYDGIAEGLDKNEVTYRLITYKNSKIVHTLIPLTKKYNKQEKRIINFARGNPKATLKLSNHEYQVRIPYKDEYSLRRYIIIRENPQDKEKMNWYIQINSPYERPISTELQIATRKMRIFVTRNFYGK